jgi:hypothetical protein
MDVAGAVPQAHLMWPQVGPPYDQALHLAVEAVLAACQPVGIIAAGSVLRGQGGLTSDIDLYVIQLAPFRQRLQRRFAGVPFEIFVNPPHQVRRYFEEERRRRQPITAHMLATGFVVLDADPVVGELRREAALELAQPPAVDAGAQTMSSYLIVDMLDNVRDVLDEDPVLAELLLWRVTNQLVEWRLAAAGGWLPRVKEMLSLHQRIDPNGAVLLHQVESATTAQERLPAVAALARHTLGVDTFFEWDSAPEDLAVSL